MKPFSHIDMFEVTRLTREGRLDEAMAMLRGEVPAPAPMEPASKAPDPSHPAIDLVPPVARDALWALPRAEPRGDASHGGLGRLTGFDLKSLGADGAHGRRPILFPDGASFETRTFSNHAGSRAYKLYVPNAYQGQPLPLIVMLHGCTQSPDDFAAGTRMNEVAEERGFLVAYPAQPKSANPSKCWNWFNAGDQVRDHGEPSLIAGIVREVMQDFSVAPGRVYIAGLSAGGAAAAIMGASYPDLFDGVGVHSGLPCGAANDLSSAFGAMRDGGSTTPAPRPLRGAADRVRTIVFHGDRDMTVNPINGDRVIAQARGADLKALVSRGVSADGVRFTRTVESDHAGDAVLEHWVLHDVGHAWSGGSTAGSYTEPRGPDASREMARFFLDRSAGC